MLHSTHASRHVGTGRSSASAVAVPTVLMPPAAHALHPLAPSCSNARSSLLGSMVLPQGPEPSRTHRRTALQAAAAHQATAAPAEVQELKPGFQVLIAGAGISGLTLALGLLKKGIKVLVLERDLTAVRGEGKLRGPIQIQSNALAALEAIDPGVAQQIYQNSCITGDRINGLCDGVSGAWYCKFDTFHPAVDRGLPVTRVINRITLQEILSEAVFRYGGEQVIVGSSHVVSYEEYKDAAGKPRVAAMTEDGRRYEGDVLVGTDGIWSKVRKQLLGETKAHYSDYTCYTGISDYVAADIDMVAYRVFLGNGKYFVTSDVGEGKTQWYAFNKEPAGGDDEPGTRKQRLLELFGHWNYNVVDLIKATPEEDVLRRDIYDRAPVFSWSQGRVALMGDSAHAMQPNLGQGGCMAIEDAFVLVNDLVDAVSKSAAAQQEVVPVERTLKHYEQQRIIRVAAIHGMARMAAFMAATYKAFLGEGMGALSWLTEYQIHHPGRVGGQAVLKLTMPAVLQWVLGGNTSYVDKMRVPSCRISDKPRHFEVSEFDTFMKDDDTLLTERINPDWLIVAERAVAPVTRPAATGAYAMAMTMGAASTAPGVPSAAMLAAPAATSAADSLPRYGLPPYEYKGVCLNLAKPCADSGKPIVRVGSGPNCQLVVSGASELHAEIERQSSQRYVLRDLGGKGGTWVNGKRLAKGAEMVLHAGDHVEFGKHPALEKFQIKWQHVSYRESVNEVRGDSYNRINIGCMSSIA